MATRLNAGYKVTIDLEHKVAFDVPHLPTGPNLISEKNGDDSNTSTSLLLPWLLKRSDHTKHIKQDKAIPSLSRDLDATHRGEMDLEREKANGDFNPTTNSFDASSYPCMHSSYNARHKGRPNLRRGEGDGERKQQKSSDLNREEVDRLSGTLQ
ncbi:hypothetical protein ACJRO7_024163 [Eucalyptus globulus]|uniref:Uncharacterized protein n=1 Tax=Eucalyptus globulus TaxID=34317 RepID=A0ABD3KH17_EUCGL